MLGFASLCAAPIAGRWQRTRSTEASATLGAAPLVSAVFSPLRESGPLDMGAAALATMSLAGMVIRLTSLIATASGGAAMLGLTAFGGRPGRQWMGDPLAYAYPRDTPNTQTVGVSRPAVASQVAASRSATSANPPTSRTASGVANSTQRSATS